MVALRPPPWRALQPGSLGTAEPAFGDRWGWGYRIHRTLTRGNENCPCRGSRPSFAVVLSSVPANGFKRMISRAVLRDDGEADRCGAARPPTGPSHRPIPPQVREQPKQAPRSRHRATFRRRGRVGATRPWFQVSESPSCLWFGRPQHLNVPSFGSGGDGTSRGAARLRKTLPCADQMAYRLTNGVARGPCRGMVVIGRLITL